MNVILRKVSLFALLCASLVVQAFETGQTIRVASGTRSLFVKNSSLKTGEAVQMWTETNTNSQRWVLEAKSDTSFYLKNVYGGFYLQTAATSNNSAASQGAKSNRAIWMFEPVAGKKDTYIIYQGTNKKFCLAVPADNSVDGNTVTIITAATAPAERCQWVVETTTPVENYLTEAIRDDMMNKWRDHYYHKASTGYVIGKGGWWGDAEMFEVVIDAYETTGDIQYLTMFDNLYKNFCQRNNTDWSGNSFNDDIAWMCIACIRAYLLSGNTDYRDKAKANFDKMYTRADKYGDGTLIWCQNWEGGGPAGTNSCINGPAAVCACYLGIAYGTESYFTKAQKIYKGEREKLMEKNADGSLTGKVWDSYNQKEGKVGNYWASSYNQGTNLGAAMMLYNHFGDPQYKKDADAIMTWTYNNMKNEYNILTACQNVTGDLAGFKAILMRYVRRYAVEHNAPKYYDWLRTTAYHAWNNRNSKGVTSGGYLTKTEEDFKRGNDSYDTDGVGAMGCLSAAFNGHLGVNNEWNAYEPMDAARFNFIQNANIQPGDDEGQTRIASKMRNKCYVGFRLVDFGTKTASHLTVRARTLRGSTTKISVYADQPSSTKGKLLCTLSAEDFSALNQWQTITKELALPIEGKHDIYVVATGTANYDLVDFNYLQFDSRYTLFADITNLNGPLTSSMTQANMSALIDGSATTDVKLTASGIEDKWIQYDAQMPVKLSAYSLWSGLTAGTAPTAYKLFGSMDGEAFTLIDDVAEAGFTTCGQCRLRTVNPANEYRYFRLQLEAATTTLSLSEFQLIGTGLSTTDITADGGSTTQGYESLTDHSSSTSIQVPATVDYKSLGNYCLAAYSVTGTNAGDTLSWTLQGSANGSSWKNIDAQTNVCVPYDNNTMVFRLASDAIYSQYRIIFKGAAANVVEWQLFGPIDFGTFFADAAEICKKEDRFQALTDNDGTTSAVLEGDQTIYLNSPIPLKVLGCSFAPSNDGTFDPAEFDLFAVEGTDSIYLSYLEPLVFPLRGMRMGKTYTTYATYNDVRVKFNSNTPEQTKSSLAEFELYATAIAEKDADVFPAPLSVEASVVATGSSYGVEKLNDQSSSTRYQAAFTAPVSITFTYDAPQVFDTYAITPYSSSNNRPKSWTLEASNDGSSWKTIGSAQDQQFYASYSTQFYTTTQGETAYSKYRLTIDEVNGGSQLQLAEVQLLALQKSPATAVDRLVKTTASLSVMDGMMSVKTPSSATLRFYDLQGRLLQASPIAAGQSLVAFPAVKGVVVAVMNVNGKNYVMKVQR